MKYIGILLIILIGTSCTAFLWGLSDQSSDWDDWDDIDSTIQADTVITPKVEYWDTLAIGYEDSTWIYIDGVTTDTTIYIRRGYGN